MKILVVGGRGYLGQGFTSAIDLPAETVIWDLAENIFNLNHQLIKDMNINAIVNFSVIANFTDKGIDTKSDYFKVNVKGIEHLVNVASEANLPIIQISTREVIGIRNWKVDSDSEALQYRGLKLIDEEEPCKPDHPYGKTKLISEFIALNYKKASVVRLNTCYTSNFSISKGLVATLINKSRNDGKVILDNNGVALRDPLHIEDLSRLILNIFEKQAFGEIFHAGGGKDNFLSLADICKMANSNFELLAGRQNTDLGFLMNIQKAEHLLGWQPKIVLSDVLKMHL